MADFLFDKLNDLFRHESRIFKRKNRDLFVIHDHDVDHLKSYSQFDWVVNYSTT